MGAVCRWSARGASRSRSPALGISVRVVPASAAAWPAVTGVPARVAQRRRECLVTAPDGSSETEGMEVVACAADQGGGEKRLYLTGIPSLEEWSAILGSDVWPVGAGEGFALFVALDTPRISADLIGEFATWCIEHGLFAVSVWGNDCERVHDIFDEVDVHLELTKRDAGFLDRSPVVMTSWHASESIQDALDFFWSCSIPDDGMTPGPCRMALVVGNPAMEDWIRAWANHADV